MKGSDTLQLEWSVGLFSVYRAPNPSIIFASDTPLCLFKSTLYMEVPLSSPAFMSSYGCILLSKW